MEIGENKHVAEILPHRGDKDIVELPAESFALLGESQPDGAGDKHAFLGQLKSRCALEIGGVLHAGSQVLGHPPGVLGKKLAGIVYQVDETVLIGPGIGIERADSHIALKLVVSFRVVPAADTVLERKIQLFLCQKELFRLNCLSINHYNAMAYKPQLYLKFSSIKLSFSS